MFIKRSLLTTLFSLIVVGLLLAGCGNSGSTNTGSSTPTAAPTTAPAATPTPVLTPTMAITPGTSAAVVKTASATVGGKTVTILTNAQGLTLYYYKPDTSTTAACTGGCASAWPPLLFTGSGTPTSATPLPGTLSVVTSANGAQVQYQGHFLYTFGGDSAPGDTHGEGIGNVWYVATTDLTASSAGSKSGY
jgi:predicted lipoprotein with Yx(FWY)xxD motif